MASNDPEFERKAADIQALDRLDPVLPLSPGRAERHGFEYYRHGRLSLYAALNVKTDSETSRQRRFHRVPHGPRRSRSS
jgi:hypothetical protein